MKNDKQSKPLYNYDMEFDISSLPKYLIDSIHLLEKYDKKGDWFNYDLEFDDLEVNARFFLRHNQITEKEYKTLIAKYGGLYD